VSVARLTLVLAWSVFHNDEGSNYGVAILSGVPRVEPFPPGRKRALLPRWHRMHTVLLAPHVLVPFASSITSSFSINPTAPGAIMARKTIAVRDLLAQAEANGYMKGKHKEQDKVRDRHKHVAKTKKDHDAALNRYVLYVRLFLPREMRI
jgi:hypothetical protein